MGALNLRFREADGCESDESGVDVGPGVLDCLIGVDSSFGRKPSSSSSAILDESLFSINCRMLCCLRRGLMVPSIETSAAGASCSLDGALFGTEEDGRLLVVGIGTGPSIFSPVRLIPFCCFCARAAATAPFPACTPNFGATGCEALRLVWLCDLCAPVVSPGATAPLANTSTRATPRRFRPLLFDMISLSLSSLSLRPRPIDLCASVCWTCCAEIVGTLGPFATRLAGLGWLSFLRFSGGRGIV